jgi:hypothetical protein
MKKVKKMLSRILKWLCKPSIQPDYSHYDPCYRREDPIDLMLKYGMWR